VDTGSSPSVQYNYADGGGQYVRLTNVTYPDGRSVGYDYASGVDEIMSRVSSIFDDADSDGVLDGGEDVYASYKYLGSGTIVEEDYEDIEVKLSYLDSNGDITGLDRFGRIEDQIWTDYGTDPDEVIDHYTYTYDRAGNRLSKDNELHSAFDEDYAYLCMCQLGGGDFLGFVGNFSKRGVGWSSFSQMSMAA